MKENREKVMGTFDSGMRLVEVKPKVFEFVDKATYAKLLAEEANNSNQGPLQQQQNQDCIFSYEYLFSCQPFHRK
jgi:hypothetical protein